MKSILDKVIVLKLNKQWMKIGSCTPKQAFINMSSSDEESGVCALDIEYGINPDGTPNFDVLANATPCNLEQWLALPVRSYDWVVRMPHSVTRAPTIVVAKHFTKMPLKKIKLNKTNLYKRDKGRCGYTGELLSKKDATVDHIQSRATGGQNIWTNVILAKKSVNHSKGSMTVEQAGLKLLVKPFEPHPIPVSFQIVTPLEEMFRDWHFF